MSNNLKFEFDFDEIIEGIKQGVIRELSEMDFKATSNDTINKIKSEIKNEVELTYGDKHDLKEEIKSEIKDKVFKYLIDDIQTKYLSEFNKYIKNELLKNQDRLERLKKDITEEVSDRLYSNLYSDVQYKITNQMQNVIKQLMNSVGGNNIKIQDTNDMITQDDYKHLLDRNRKLEALENGGVDNWEWYGESLSQYYDNDEDD